MGGVKQSDCEITGKRAGISPLAVGSLLCLAAAMLYASVYVCLRYLSHGDSSTWALCVKESVSVVLVGPWLAWQVWRGRRVFPSGRAMFALVVAGLATQLIANVAQLWAFGVVGLSIAVPVTQGTNLTSAAVMGRVFLGERVSLPALLAIGLLIAAIALLSLGAPHAQSSIATLAEDAANRWKALAGVAAAILAGVVYASLAVTIRRTVTSDTSPTIVLIVITAMGMLSLAPLSWYRCGLAPLLHVSGSDLLVMLASGVMNLVAFAAIIKGIQMTSVVRANLISSSQTAFAALAGMLLFGEVLVTTTLIGLGLCMLGMLAINYPADPPPQAS